jgi:integrase
LIAAANAKPASLLMEPAMPRPRPPFLQREVTRHGKVVWFVRRDHHGPRIRIKASFDSVEFWAEYEAALAGRRTSVQTEVSNSARIGSLAWLYAGYRETGAWTELSPATRRQRENILKHVMDSAGQEPAHKITQATIIKGLERRDKTPAQARNFLDAMRGIFKWAVRRGHLKVDPTAGIRTPTRKKGPGFVMWSEEQMVAYERRWPIGTKERVWLDVLAYTGLRRGDAVRLGRQHVRDGVATITTEKSGHNVKVTLPILPALAATLAAGPCGDLSFIVGVNGKPLSKESFGNLFRQACRQAGVPGSAHGVRKIAATRAAENGATVAELEAIFGWHGGGMAALYTRDADRVRLSKAAMHKLSNETVSNNALPRSVSRPTR